MRLSLYCRQLVSLETVPLLFLVRLSLYCRQRVSRETVPLLPAAALARETVPLFAQVGKEFGTVMKKVFEHLETLDFDEKTINSIGRVVHIWEERGIFDKRIQAKRGLKRKKSALSSLFRLCFASVRYFLNSQRTVPVFDEKTINSIGRVVHIWEERGIFDKRIQARGVKRKKCSYTYLRNLFVTADLVLLPYF